MFVAMCFVFSLLLLLSIFYSFHFYSLQMEMPLTHSLLKILRHLCKDGTCITAFEAFSMYLHFITLYSVYGMIEIKNL